MNYSVQTKAPHSMYLGILAINISNKSNVIGTPDTRVQRPMDGFYWSASDHIFDKAIVAGFIATKSDHDYNSKLVFKFGGRIINLSAIFLMSRPPLESNTIDTNKKKVKTSYLESSPVGTKTPEPKPLTRPTGS